MEWIDCLVTRLVNVFDDEEAAGLHKGSHAPHNALSITKIVLYYEPGKDEIETPKPQILERAPPVPMCGETSAFGNLESKGSIHSCQQ